MARTKKPTREELEQAMEICRYLDADQRNQLLEQVRIETFKRNQVIYSEGEKPTDIMCLLNGKVKISKTGVGRSHIVRMVRPKGYFAYRAFFAEDTHSTTATAFETCQVGIIPGKMLLDMIHRNNDLAFYFIHALAVDLAVSDSRQVNLTQKHIRGRLAESLLYMRNHYGLEEDGATINIYLSREDLANMSNMTTSNAIRTLSQFVEEKVLAIDGRRIKIINPSQLERISRLG